MKRLDDDIARAPTSKGKKKKRIRDIVKFVPFSELKRDPYMLAKEVLEEVPKQMLDYFSMRNIKPNPKRMDDKQQQVIQGLMHD